MTREQAINYLASSGMTDDQINEVVTAINRTETQEFKQEFLRMASYIDCLLECSDEQKETLINFIARLSEYMPWYEDDDFEVEKHTPERTETHSCDCGKKEAHGDVISRQAAIDVLWKALYEYEDKTEKQFIDSEELDVADWIQHRIFVQNMSDIDRQTIRTLPSAEPERKTGEWVETDLDNFRKYEVVCSECGSRYIGNYDAYDEPCDFNYCPNCGAKMEVEE